MIPNQVEVVLPRSSRFASGVESLRAPADSATGEI